MIDRMQKQVASTYRLLNVELITMVRTLQECGEKVAAFEWSMPILKLASMFDCEAVEISGI